MQRPQQTVYVLLFLILFSAALFGQADRGNITGEVKDSSGALIPGAKVTVTNVETVMKTIAFAQRSNQHADLRPVIENYDGADLDQSGEFGWPQMGTGYQRLDCRHAADHRAGDFYPRRATGHGLCHHGGARHLIRRLVAHDLCADV